VTRLYLYKISHVNFCSLQLVVATGSLDLNIRLVRSFVKYQLNGYITRHPNLLLILIDMFSTVQHLFE
jgi:hypothetical protein